MNAPAIQIDGIIIPVHPHPEHEYTLTTAEVAAGYGVSEITIRRHKKEHSSELLEGKHFSSVQNLNAGNLQRVKTIWTKRGIIRLGFFLRSERAKRFRDLAEDLVLRETTAPGTLPDLSGITAAIQTLTDEMRSLRQAITRPIATRRARTPRHRLTSSAPCPRQIAHQFFAAHVRHTGDDADRLPISDLYIAYRRWIADRQLDPGYLTPQTLSKALINRHPTLRRYWRRCTIRDRREVCYLAHQLI